jgi:hypothetical protein
LADSREPGWRKRGRTTRLGGQIVFISAPSPVGLPKVSAVKQASLQIKTPCEGNLSGGLFVNELTGSGFFRGDFSFRGGFLFGLIFTVFHLLCFAFSAFAHKNSFRF